MDWKDVGSIVAKGAPILGAALGGPVGAIAGAAGSLVASLFGCEDSPEAVEKAIKQNPDALLKLKELEARENARMLQWKQAQLNAEIVDRDSARERDTKITQIKGGNTRADVLAYLSIIALIGVVAALFMFPVPDGSARDLLLVLTGCLINIVKDVYGFEFGSSRGEQDAKPQVS
ncbi:hypothetical protein [Halodesulfovibrio aestuarii]|uniref:TMhelix containing protein n=1 Tax=Halodesulfovibrio aestuarii TaxID=126333 RepID=A0ABV4JMW9_9BACT